MKLFFPAFLLLLLNACHQKNKQVNAAQLAATTTLSTPINYDSCKKQILVIKQKSKISWAALSKEEREKIFTRAVAETIVLLFKKHLCSLSAGSCISKCAQ